LASRIRDSKNWLERYQAGEHEQVWAELLSLGDKVREATVLPDAVAVVRETMRRCRENIERLFSRLRIMGYEFKFPDEAFVPPVESVFEQIAAIEDHVGPIPLSLCAWYEVVGSVNFMGSHPQWRGHHVYPDPLVVSPSNYILAYDEENWYRERYSLEIAPDYYHKENVSGGPPYTISLPNAAIDAPLEYEWHETTFVNYLRLSFQWGGFPGWERYPEDSQPTTLLRKLTADLLPI
jgi:hypothetical protein